MRWQKLANNRMLLKKHTICRTIFVDLRCDSAYNCPNGTPGPETGRAGGGAGPGVRPVHGGSFRAGAAGVRQLDAGVGEPHRTGGLCAELRAAGGGVEGAASGPEDDLRHRSHPHLPARRRGAAPPLRVVPPVLAGGRSAPAVPDRDPRPPQPDMGPAARRSAAMYSCAAPKMSASPRSNAVCWKSGCGSCGSSIRTPWRTSAPSGGRSWAAGTASARCTP